MTHIDFDMYVNTTNAGSNLPISKYYMRGRGQSDNPPNFYKRSHGFTDRMREIRVSPVERR